MLKPWKHLNFSSLPQCRWTHLPHQREPFGTAVVGTAQELRPSGRRPHLWSSISVQFWRKTVKLKMEANGSHEKSWKIMKINHLNMRFSQRQEAGQCLEKQCRKVLVQADHPCRVFLFDPRMSCFQKIWYPKFDGVSSLSSMKKQPFMEGPASPFSDKQMNHHIPISRFMSWNLNRLYIVHYCTLLYTIFSIKAISKKRNCPATHARHGQVVRSWDDSHAPALEPSMGHRRFFVRQRRWFSQWFHHQKWWAPVGIEHYRVTLW